MAQTMKLGKHATKVTRNKDALGSIMRVKYHQTYIVTVTDTEIILAHGWWKTASTKTRMNQASNQYDLGYQVYQKAGEWYVDFKGVTYPFDGESILLIR